MDCDGDNVYAFNTTHTFLEMNDDEMEDVDALENGMNFIIRVSCMLVSWIINL